MRLQLDRSFFIPKDSIIFKEQGAAIIYSHKSQTGKDGIVGLAFYGKAQKPSWHYIFKTEEQLTAYADRWLTSMGQHEQYMNERKQARQSAHLDANIKAGEYFVTSWGYDQTNIDYLVVASISPSGKTAYCKMADAINVGGSEQQDALIPGTSYGDTFPMKITGKDSLTGSYSYCRGSKKMGYFHKTALGDVQYQTNPVFGH